MKPRPMEFPARILIAPDKFKGTLSAPAAAEAMAAGVRRFAANNQRAQPELLLRPLADGGEGSHDVLQQLPDKEEHRINLTAASGQIHPAPYLSDTPNNPRAPRDFYLETARVIGLQDPANRAIDIEDRTTAGIGEWIDQLVRANLKQPANPDTPAALTFHLFLGGSATSDGGFGLARALGFWFYDEDDARVHDFRALDRLRTILVPDPSIFDPAIHVRIYTDVLSPLLGPDGAAHLFGPQKGATPEQVDRMEERLRRMQTALIAATGLIETDRPGLGAAGGLALPLAYWSRAQTEFASGIDFFLEATGVEDILHTRPPDLVLTGEGGADRGTLAGKVPAGVARLCQKKNIPVALAAGMIKPADRAALEAAEMFTALFATPDFCEPLAELPGTAEAAERLTHSVAMGLERLYGN